MPMLEKLLVTVATLSETSRRGRAFSRASWYPHPVILHVHCGDCGADVARSAPLPGDITVWKDSPAVGPIARDFAAHRRLRAQWWGAPPEAMQDPRELPRGRPVALWFGPDPWEQLALVELLAGWPEDPATEVTLVPLDVGVGLMRPDQLPARFARRTAAPAREPLRRLWADLCADDRDALTSAVTELRGHPRLPHLAAALARVLADRRDALTERRVRALVAAGVRDVPTLMRRLRALEAPQHGAWYGDTIITRLRDRALAGP